MRTTIKDIARVVGVSPSTVSRVINGTAPISEDMKNRIFQVMKELNYHPDSRARNLANGSTYTIALVIDAEDEHTFSNSFFDRSVYAIERIAQENGYNLLITNRNGTQENSIGSLIYEKKVDGLILPSSCTDEALISMLEEEEASWVILGEPYHDSPQELWVDIDNRHGSFEAVRYLGNKGYRKIAIVVEQEQTVFAARRIDGFLQGKIEMQLEQFQNEIIFADENRIELKALILHQIRDKSVDAYLCSNNHLAFAVLQTLKAEGVNIPNETGVLTFDNYPLAEYLDPPLTAIDVDTYQLGAQAADLLIRKIRKHDIQERQIRIPTNCIERKSTEKERK